MSIGDFFHDDNVLPFRVQAFRLRTRRRGDGQRVDEGERAGDEEKQRPEISDSLFHRGAG